MTSLILATFLACGDSAPEKKVEAPKKEAPAQKVAKPEPKKEPVKVEEPPKEEPPKEEPPKAEETKAEEAKVASAGTADGKQVYTKVCQQCHQATGTGIPTLYPPLAQSDWIKKDAMGHRLEEDIAHIFWDHGLPATQPGANTSSPHQIAQPARAGASHDKLVHVNVC